MSPILILRSEIVCAVVLILMMSYSIVYSYTREKLFIKMCILGLAHVIFDGITVVTVNNLDTVGKTVNDILHMFMYLFALLFVSEMFCYIIKNLVSITDKRKYLNLARVPVFVYVILMPFLEIEYWQGNGTMYSMGNCAVAGFALTTAYVLVGTVILIINFRKLDKSIIFGLLPCNIFALICVGYQIMVPEFLFTGATLTLVAVGLFFAVENPAVHFKKRAYIDIDTGIKNKNCYNEDMKRLNEELFLFGKKDIPLICVVCDLNYLKLINDHYGHIAGDEMIHAAADVLSKNLRSAHNVYRIGGDEFVAVFIDKSRDIVEKEIAEVRNSCGKYTDLKYPLSIAMGSADIADEEFSSVFDIISLADKRMYEDKVRIKQSAPFEKLGVAYEN